MTTKTKRKAKQQEMKLLKRALEDMDPQELYKSVKVKNKTPNKKETMYLFFNTLSDYVNLDDRAMSFEQCVNLSMDHILSRVIIEEAIAKAGVVIDYEGYAATVDSDDLEEVNQLTKDVMFLEWDLRACLRDRMLYLV